MKKRFKKYLRQARKWLKKNSELTKKAGFVFLGIIAFFLIFLAIRALSGNLFIGRETLREPVTKYDQGVNLVFYADRYDSWSEFEGDVEAVMRGVRSVEPWKSYDRFNVYRIFPGHDVELCQVKTADERKPVLRCEQRINRYFGKLKLVRAKFIVLSRQNFQSWATVARLANSGIFFSLPAPLNQATEVSNGYLFLHLLGHAFGLKDEEKYVIARADGAPHTPDGPNCAPDLATAQKWWGELVAKYPGRVGYFKTCAGSDDYIKPSRGSLMNFGDMTNFIPSYEPVSTEYLSNILDYCFKAGPATTGSGQNFLERYPEFKACK